MSINILNGLFVIEGLDGSGKTTLTQALAKEFTQLVPTMQPSPGPFGQEIRNVLKGDKIMETETLLNLFIKDRQWHQNWMILQIAQGKKIVLDRYILSTLAYQGLYFPQHKLWEINAHFKIPQMTFFIDLPPAIALERKKEQMEQKQQNMEIFEVFELQEKIWLNYKTGLDILEQNGYPIIKLNGELSREELLVQCKKYFQGEKLYEYK